MDTVLLIGRILFSIIFLSSGLMGHIVKNKQMAQYAQYKRVPMASFAVYVTGLMLILGSVSVIFGIYADLGVLLWVVFLIPTAFIMHAFWKEADETAKMNEQVAFFKDLALAGASLIVFAVLHAGADFGPHIGTLLAFKK
ncbi:MAG: DoxX family protein [Candidatus Nanopelagicaceae bacterium]